MAFPELDGLLGAHGIRLREVLAADSFVSAFHSNHVRLLRFLFAHSEELLEMATGQDDNGNWDKAHCNALLSLMTRRGQFAAELAMARPFLRKLSSFFSPLGQINRKTLGRLCLILSRLVFVSNGHVLTRFPAKGDFFQNLLRYLETYPIFDFFLDLLNGHYAVLREYLAEVGGVQHFFACIGQNPVVNHHSFVILCNLLALDSPKVRFSSSFLEKERLDLIFVHACSIADEKVSLAAMKLLDSLIGMLRPEELEFFVKILLHPRVRDFCSIVMASSAFSRSKAMAISILSRAVPCLEPYQLDPIVELLKRLLVLFTEHLHHTFIHSCFMKLLEPCLTKMPCIIRDLRLKETILYLYSRRSELENATGWGFLHKIASMIIKGNEVDSDRVDGWEDFADNLFHWTSLKYLETYGGSVPRDFRLPRLPSDLGIEEPIRVSPRSLALTCPGAAEAHIQGSDVKWIFATLVPDEQHIQLDLITVLVAGAAPTRIVFSPDGKVIAMSGGSDAEVYCLDDKQTLLLQVSFESAIATFGFTQQDHYIAFFLTDDDTVSYFSLETGKLAKQERFGSYSMIFVARDFSVIGGCRPDKTDIYRTSDLGLVRSYAHEHRSLSCARFSHNGKYYGFGYEDGGFDIFSFETGDIIFKCNKCYDSRVEMVMISGDAKMWITAESNNCLRLWKNRGENVDRKDLGNHRGRVTCLDVCPSEEWMISGSTDGGVILSSLKRSEMMCFVRAHSGPINAVSFCDREDAVMFATASDDLLVKVWTFEQRV
jgi:hypothetical protein